MIDVVNPYVRTPQPQRPATRPASAPPEGPTDEIVLQPPAFATGPAAVSDKEEAGGSRFAAAAGTALLVAGAMSGLVGTMMPTITALTGPTMSTVDSHGQVQTREMPPAVSTPEQASDRIHLISNLDATEGVIEPFATNGLGEIQQVTRHGNVTADVAIERHANPLGKLAVGGAVTAISLAPFIIARKIAKKQDSTLLAIGITMAGIMGVGMVGGMVGGMHDGVGNIVSAVSDFKHQEGVWSGHREMHMANGQRQAGAVVDGEGKVVPGKVADFLAEHMKEYPHETTVVHLMGHGLMYRHVSGMSGEEFGRVVSDATTRAGRPIDVLVLESCLQGNLEVLNSVYPHARYAVVSEESIAAGATGRIFDKSAAATAGHTVTPRELATEMVKASKGDPGVETLAVVDLTQMPQLNESINKLGGTLLAEVRDGRTDVIRSAVDGTPVYPLDETATAKKLAIGDLKVFASNLVERYATDSSPRAAQIRDDARGVLDALDKAVVSYNGTERYANHGGISIQMPGMKMDDLEKKADVLGARGLSSYGSASAPDQWRTFVSEMSPQMAPPTPAR